MEYNKIDKLIKVETSYDTEDELAIEKVNELLDQGWVLLNIEYSREVGASSILSYILGHLKEA